MRKKFEDSENECKENSNRILKDVRNRMEKEIRDLKEKNLKLENEVKESYDKIKEMKEVMLNKDVRLSE